jgi:hypothetical protein
MRESGDERGVVEGSATLPRPELHALVGCPAFELAVKRRESLLGDLLLVGSPNVLLGPWPELLGGDLLGSPSHAVGDVGSVEPHLVPSQVDPAHDDVSMGCSVLWWLTAPHSSLRPMSRSTRAMTRRT